MKLNDSEIELRCKNPDKNGGLPLVDPFNPTHLTPNGYDLSLDEIEIGGKIQKFESEGKIPPKTPFKVMSLETVNLTKDLVAQLWLKSSYARKGIMATFGFVDSGYHGKIAMSLFNSTDEYIFLSKKSICQIVFESFTEPEKAYPERSGNYQNQKTLENGGIKNG